ncbi:hypothetical protein SAMN05443144_11772 [Fodinibius roseus]|uniref:Uncharacterized protein n=1 Tax=Fodinibius roseus TaxID=1194090 RepID=A0A1M5GJ37_9BACT|nr:hypothetical protein SAMN05443144_11772 [Fodinibius roseus]
MPKKQNLKQNAFMSIDMVILSLINNQTCSAGIKPLKFVKVLILKGNGDGLKTYRKIMGFRIYKSIRRLIRKDSKK